MRMTTVTNNLSLDVLKRRALQLGLFGIVSRWSELAAEPWLPSLIECEENERARRSLERRTKSAKLGKFKPL